MSGPENLRGIDYQISCSLLLILQALAENRSSLIRVKIESIDDESEDLTLEFHDGRTMQVQLKKLAEGYNWTPTTLRPVLSRFSRISNQSDFVFISDGSASRQLLPLKRFLEGDGELTDEDMKTVCGEGLSPSDLRSLRGRVRIQTRYFPSSDESDPAGQVTAEIHRLLIRGPFSLKRDVVELTNRLWRTLYAAGQAATVLTNDELWKQFGEAGLIVVERDWALYPTVARYYEHTQPTERIVKTLQEGGIGLIFGIGGSGKTTFVAEAATAASQTASIARLRSVCQRRFIRFSGAAGQDSTGQQPVSRPNSTEMSVR